jgi:hypothetical protein
MDGRSEYHLVYTRGALPREEVFTSELEALGRASALMGRRPNHDFSIRDGAGQMIHNEGSLQHTTRLLRGR